MGNLIIPLRLKWHHLLEDYHLPMTLTISGDQVIATINGKEHTISVRAWTDWIDFEYKINPLITLKGAGRFYLDYIQDGRFKLYLTPVHLHPSNPLLVKS